MAQESGMFCWFECGTTDAAAAKDFYTRLFGWSAVDVPKSGDTGESYTLLQVDGADIAGLYELAGPKFEGDRSHWLIYAAVDDCDETLASAAAMGARTIVRAQDVPNVGRFGVIADPTGAVIAVIKLTGHG